MSAIAPSAAATPADAPTLVLDAVTRARAVELAGQLVEKSAALEQSTSDPLAALRLAKEIMDISSELDEGIEPAEPGGQQPEPVTAEPVLAQQPVADLTYRQTDDMFTSFFANTPAGIEAWNVMAKDNDGTGKVLTMHAKSVIQQLRAAGYTVRKENGAQDMDDDELMAALEEQPPEQAAEPEPAPASPNSIAQGRDALTALAPFLSVSQRQALRASLSGEEGQYFIDLLVDLQRHIATMPKTYDQDDKGDEAQVFLHYFAGGSDWYITEKDMEGNGTQQAFGYAILNGDTAFAELGYISIEELVTVAKAELDLNWSVKSLGAVKVEKEPEPLKAATANSSAEPAAEIDPTEPATYAALTDEQKLYWQDRLDSVFQGRVIAVRNALRALGWDGSMMGDLSKNGTEAVFDFEHVGAGRNVAGMTVNGIRDDLTRTPEELAKAVDALLPDSGAGDLGAYLLNQDAIRGLSQELYEAQVAEAEHENRHDDALALRAGRMGSAEQYREALSIRAAQEAAGELTPDLSARAAALSKALYGPATAVPERPADMAFLEQVKAGSLDMMDEDLGDKLEAIAGKYPDDAEVLDLWKQAVAAYSDHMAKALSGQ